jgi:hemolysin activation/secretion protein
MKRPRVDLDNVSREMTAVALFAQNRPQDENQQTSKPANTQTREPASRLAGQPVSQLAGKPPKKFSTYLDEQSIKQLKRIAVEEDRKDYEVLQEAVDHYLKSK